MFLLDKYVCLAPIRNELGIKIDFDSLMETLENIETSPNFKFVSILAPFSFFVDQIFIFCDVKSNSSETFED